MEDARLFSISIGGRWPEASISGVLLKARSSQQVVRYIRLRLISGLLLMAFPIRVETPAVAAETAAAGTTAATAESAAADATAANTVATCAAAAAETAVANAIVMLVASAMKVGRACRGALVVPIIEDASRIGDAMGCACQCGQSLGECPSLIQVDRARQGT